MLHSRMRWLIAAVALVVTLATTLLAGPALRSTLAASNRPQEYLALGNSVAFGFNPLLDRSNADNFIGYPNTVATALKEKLTNASCPGETSSHFISLAGTDLDCGAYRLNFPLHVAYSTSQLDFADGFLQSHPKTLVVSIDIGANDLFVLENGCGGASTPAEINCILAGLPAMLATLSANLDTIYGHIRNMDGYHHKLVALTYYSLNYSDPTGTNVISQVNQVVADRTLAWGGIVADGFDAFADASTAYGGDTCAAGLRIVVLSSPLTCDIHPSPAGRDLLARAIVKALRTDD
ncbi:MAG TPA: SGNH/GDSL hydrolase family protein [Ktedonobacteraceae bacterium]